jgi:uncharacterized membrane protein
MEPVELIVAVFEESVGANGALKDLKALESERRIKIFNAAVLVKDESGKAHLRETSDLDARQGAVLGAATGGLVGLLAGPLGVLVGAAVGAATGSVAAGQIDQGFSNDFLKEVQESIKPGNSALLLLVEEPWNERIASELGQRSGRMFRHAVKSEIASRISGSGQE